MHDIICPKCGERYIARDVAFDFSDFIEPLIKDSYIIDENQRFRFKYYIDEEDIAKSTENFAYAEGGSVTDSSFMPFEVSCKTIVSYIGRFIDGDCDVFFNSIVHAAQNRRRGENVFGRERINDLRNIFNKCFEGSDTEFDSMSGENICSELMLRLLCFVWKNRESKIRIRIRLNLTVYGDTNGAAVPDALLAVRDDGSVVKIPKSCPVCHRVLSAEFGHYRSVFVGMLGEEKDSKTSFLQGLLKTVRYDARPPFDASVNGFVIDSLSGEGGAAIDPESPMLTLRSGVTLITFVDIPTESPAYLKTDAEHIELDNRRKQLICQCSHFVCFIPNGRLLPCAEENFLDSSLCTDLLHDFGKCVALSQSAAYKTVRSVSVILNNIELYRHLPLAQNMCELIERYSENDIFDQNGWHDTPWETINFRTKVFLIQYLNFFINRSMSMWEQLEPAYFGISPECEILSQGTETDGDGEATTAPSPVRSPYMVGLVILYVLRREGLLPDCKSDFEHSVQTQFYADI